MTSRPHLQWRPGAAGPVLDRDEDHALDWQDAAVCASVDPELFFPEKGGSTADAKRVCRACPVRAECLEFALANDERFGIYGGLSERQRRRLKDARRATAPRRCPAGLHDMTAWNTAPFGKCRACAQEAGIVPAQDKEVAA